MDHGTDIDACLARPAEHFDDPAARGGGGIVPWFQFDDDALPGLGGGVASEIDGSVDGLVVALDPAEVAVFPEHADQAAGAAGEDFCDFAADFGCGVLRDSAAVAGETSGFRLLDGNEHAVAIERGGGIAARDVDAGQRLEIHAGREVGLVGRIREKHRVAFGVELQAAGQHIAGFRTQRETRLLTLHQQAVANQRADGLPQRGAPLRRNSKLSGQF